MFNLDGSTPFEVINHDRIDWDDKIEELKVKVPLAETAVIVFN